MARTPTKNPNLWSDSRLQLEYTSVCRELYKLVEIAKQIKAGTYEGHMKGLLDKKNLVNFLKQARKDVLEVEKYIKKREEKLKIKNEPSPFKLIKMNRDVPVVDDEMPKNKLSAEEESSLDELMKEIFKETR